MTNRPFILAAFLVAPVLVVWPAPLTAQAIERSLYVSVEHAIPVIAVGERPTVLIDYTTNRVTLQNGTDRLRFQAGDTLARTP